MLPMKFARLWGRGVMSNIQVLYKAASSICPFDCGSVFCLSLEFLFFSVWVSLTVLLICCYCICLSVYIRYPFLVLFFRFAVRICGCACVYILHLVLLSVPFLLPESIISWLQFLCLVGSPCLLSPIGVCLCVSIDVKNVFYVFYY